MASAKRATNARAQAPVDRFKALRAEAKRSVQVKDPVRYKTVLCNKFETAGTCPYGPRCQFAHGTSELRARQALQAKSDNVPEPLAGSTSKRDEVTPPPTPRPTRTTMGVHRLSDNDRLIHQAAEAPAAPRLAMRHKRLTPLEAEPGILCGACDEPSGGCVTVLAPLPPAVRQQSSAGLRMNELGRIVCRRDASHHTQTVKRVLSDIFADEAENDLSSQLASTHPFGPFAQFFGPNHTAPAA